MRYFSAAISLKCLITENEKKKKFLVVRSFWLKYDELPPVQRSSWSAIIISFYIGIPCFRTLETKSHYNTT